MPAKPAHLAAARAVVAAFARDAMDNRIALPGREMKPAELPAPVEVAREFYASHLTPEDDCFGVVLVHRLPAETGSALVVVGYNVESQWGAAEIFSPEGEAWTSGVFVAAGVGWHDADTVRAAMVAVEQPLSLIPPAETLTWISQGPVACVSAGGRYFIAPAPPNGSPGGSILNDGITKSAHECATLEAAQALAATIHGKPAQSTPAPAPAVPPPVSASAAQPAGAVGDGRWTAESEPVAGGLRYRLFENAKPMTYIELLRAWLRDTAFQEYFSSVLANSPFPVFRFELHPLSNGMLEWPCEFVLLDCPEMNRYPDRTTNAEGFAEWSFPVIDFPALGALAVKRMFHRLTTGDTNEETIRIREAREANYGLLRHVVSFVNVAQDAILIVPSARDPEHVYSHPGAFFRESNEWQRCGVWGTLADGIVKWGTMNANILMHVGTPPNGPPWFHLRVDQRPWLTYPPYRDFVPPPPPVAPPAPPPAPKRKKAPTKRAARPKKPKGE